MSLNGDCTVFGLIWYWRSNIAQFQFTKSFFCFINQLNPYIFFSLKSTKNLLLLTYFATFDFLCTLFFLNMPKFWHLIPNQIKLLDNLPCCFHSRNVSTTPLRQWGFRQWLPFSWTTLRGKHCWHPIAVMGVVDTFEQWPLALLIHH
jgi:hypothetical protein